MNTSSPWLASRRIKLVKSDGEQLDVTLRLGLPYEVSSEEWACPVALEGLHDRLHAVHGIDAWQSLQLAQSLQAQLLRYFVEDGGTLLCYEPSAPIELHELFPSISGKQRPQQ